MEKVFAIYSVDFDGKYRVQFLISAKDTNDAVDKANEYADGITQEYDYLCAEEIGLKATIADYVYIL